MLDVPKKMRDAWGRERKRRSSHHVRSCLDTARCRPRNSTTAGPRATVAASVDVRPRRTRLEPVVANALPEVPVDAGNGDVCLTPQACNVVNRHRAVVNEEGRAATRPVRSHKPADRAVVSDLSSCCMVFTSTRTGHGDYVAGRFLWRMQNCSALREPRPAMYILQRGVPWKP